jgi:hypothetical protein
MFEALRERHEPTAGYLRDALNLDEEIRQPPAGAPARIRRRSAGSPQVGPGGLTRSG